MTALRRAARHVRRVARRATLSHGVTAAVMALSTLVLMPVGSLFGSLIVVPPLVATSLVLFAGHARPEDRRWLIPLSLAVVLAPLGLEGMGLVSPAYAFTNDSIIVLPRLVHFPPGLTFIVLAIATVSAIVMPGVLAGRLRDRLADAETRLLMVAWHFDALDRVERAPARA